MTLAPRGTDWAIVVKGTHVGNPDSFSCLCSRFQTAYHPTVSHSMTLDFHCTVRTSNSYHLAIPPTACPRSRNTGYQVYPNTIPPATIFKREIIVILTFSLDVRPGLHGWRNGLVCLRVMCREGEEIWIDVYYLDNSLPISIQKML